MALNLLEQLTELDNKRIENYIQLYGIESDYIGNEEYLKYWAQNKKRLFHLLDGQLIYKFPFTSEKPQEILSEEIIRLMDNDEFMTEFRDRLYNKTTELNVDYETEKGFWQFFNEDVFIKNEARQTLKYKPEGCKKGLSFQAGMKPIRAIPKILDFFEWDDLKDSFEKFRVAHSMIFNEKKITGNLCISIHPLDFMTMSDNDSRWSSCMSWTNDGCYHVGTVEMMNSNNVVCCYIEASKDWCFSFNHKDEEAFTWNNKKWRQLFYVTKEIAVCGKAYPYQNKNFTFAILDKIKELTEQNLGRTYSFGPESYRDMNHIGSKYRMDLTRERIRNRDTFKHNIIFDSKGMYNDMFNAHYGEEDIYWCYRNKVKKTIMISYSGKAPCLCCGGEVIRENDVDGNYDGAYNDRYDNTGKVICPDCEGDRQCERCGTTGYHAIYKVQGHKLCKTCLEKYFKICPCCGEPMLIENRAKKYLYARLRNTDLYVQDMYDFDSLQWEKNDKLAVLHMCPTCRDKKRGYFKAETLTVDEKRRYYSWKTQFSPWVSKRVYSLDEIKKYLYHNLKNADVENLG